MIYWASHWATTAGANLASSMQNSVNNVLYCSPYLDGLHQYGVSFWAYAPAIPANHGFNYSDPPHGFNAAAIQGVGQDTIYTKGLPEADTYSNPSIYFVATLPVRDAPRTISTDSASPK